MEQGTTNAGVRKDIDARDWQPQPTFSCVEHTAKDIVPIFEYSKKYVTVLCGLAPLNRENALVLIVFPQP